MDVLPPQGAIVGQQFALPLTTTGGTAPYTWRLLTGDLPPGLKLQQHPGTHCWFADGARHLPLHHRGRRLEHSATNPASRHQSPGDCRSQTVEWKDSPQVQGSKIAGSAIMSNHTPDDFDLTFFSLWWPSTSTGALPRWGLPAFHGDRECEQPGNSIWVDPGPGDVRREGGRGSSSSGKKAVVSRQPSDASGDQSRQFLREMLEDCSLKGTAFRRSIRTVDGVGFSL